MAALAASTILSRAAFAQDDDVSLIAGVMGGVTPNPDKPAVIKAGKFKKDGPRTIIMSHFGVNANTWTVQVGHEADYAASKAAGIGEFVILDTGFDQKNQVAGIEDLIAQKLDAIIVMPVTTTSANASIEKALAAGIPVIRHTGRIESDAYTVEIQGGAEHFGKVMRDWLVKTVGNDGKIWVLRGLAGHPEDTNRYNGLVESLKGTNVTIIAEVHGDWQYDKAKALCETLYPNNPAVDGIWSPGADMTRAAVEVFKSFGVAIPPISGEGNNGCFGQWLTDNFKSISPEYSPAQGAAGVRAAVALLEGKALHHSYLYTPDGWDQAKAKTFYRDDLSANVWWPTDLPEELLSEFYAKT